MDGENNLNGRFGGTTIFGNTLIDFSEFWDRNEK